MDRSSLSDFLDGEIDAGRLDAVLQALSADPQAREAITTWQLIRDALGGTRALDDGYSRRILARVWGEGAADGAGPAPDPGTVGPEADAG